MKPKAPKPLETAEQRAVVWWLRSRRIGHFAVPNEAKRTVRNAARLKAQGMVSGVPDLVLLPPCPTEPGMRVAVEMKRIGGKLQDTQRSFHESMRANGWIVVVAYGAREAIEQLTKLGF